MTRPHDSTDDDGFFARLRARYRHVRHNHRYGIVLRYVTITIGAVVTVAGAITIPYPGPGWALVFVGLLILSEELEWAARLRHWIMGRLSEFYRRYIDGNRVAQVALGVGTCAIVLATLWLTNAAHLAAGWVGVEAPWLESPIF